MSISGFLTQSDVEDLTLEEVTEAMENRGIQYPKRSKRAARATLLNAFMTEYRKDRDRDDGSGDGGGGADDGSGGGGGGAASSSSSAQQNAAAAGAEEEDEEEDDEEEDEEEDEEDEDEEGDAEDGSSDDSRKKGGRPKARRKRARKQRARRERAAETRREKRAYLRRKAQRKERKDDIDAMSEYSSSGSDDSSGSSTDDESSDGEPWREQLSSASRLNELRLSINDKGSRDMQIFGQLVSENDSLNKWQRKLRIQDFRRMRFPLTKFEIAFAEADASAPRHRAARMRRAAKNLVKSLNVCLKVLVIASKDSWEDALEWEREQSAVALGYDDLLPDDYTSPKTKGKKRRRKSKTKNGKKAAGADLSSSESSDSSDDSVLRKAKSQRKPSAKAKNFAKSAKKKKKSAAQRPAKAVRKAKTKVQAQKKKKKSKSKQATKGKASKKAVRDPRTGEKIKCFTCEGNHYRSDCPHARSSSSDESDSSD
jgi:hypothetical protein